MYIFRMLGIEQSTGQLQQVVTQDITPAGTTWTQTFGGIPIGEAVGSEPYTSMLTGETQSQPPDYSAALTQLDRDQMRQAQALHGTEPLAGAVLASTAGTVAGAAGAILAAPSPIGGENLNRQHAETLMTQMMADGMTQDDARVFLRGATRMTESEIEQVVRELWSRSRSWAPTIEQSIRSGRPME